MIRLTLTPPESLRSYGNLDHYAVMELVGGGSMGYVVRALDHRTGETVAIKLLKPELAHEPLAVRRFLREARHMQHLHHPHILPLAHVVDRDPGPYLVMPWVKEGSLARRLDNQGPLTPDETLQLARPIAEAIVYAHRKGIIHRDIKPGNVLLGKRNEVWLADFGLARTLFNDSLLDVSIDQTVGTLPYMSPGRVQGVAEDTRTDIYAFGCLLYEMLTGRPPYEGDTVQEVRRNILMGPPLPLRNLKPGLSSEWTVIIEGAMARDLRNRYASMADLAGDLARMERGEALQGPGVQAVAIGSLKPGPSFVRSPILWATAVTLAVLALLTTALIRHPDTHARLVQRRTFSVPGLYGLHEARLVHWSGMTNPLLCVVQDDSVYHVSLEGDLVSHFHVSDALAERARFGAFLPSNDRQDEQVLVSWQSGSRLAVAAIDFFGDSTRAFAFQALPEEANGRSSHDPMKVFQLTDLKGDGHLKLIASVEASGATDSPGLLCYEFDTARLLWQHPLTAKADAAEIVDVDGDGQGEILITLRPALPRPSSPPKAPAPGPITLQLLNTDGTERWTWSGGEGHDQVFVLSVASTVSPKLAVGLNVRRNQNSLLTNLNAKLLRIAADGTTLRSEPLRHRITSALVTDLNNDGDEEILITDEQGRLQVFSADLEPQESLSLPQTRSHPIDFRLLAAADLDADGRPELILDSSRTQDLHFTSSGITDAPSRVTARREPILLILDADLRTQASHPLSHVSYEDPSGVARVEVLDLESEPGKEFLYLLREKAYLFSYTGLPPD